MHLEVHQFTRLIFLSCQVAIDYKYVPTILYIYRILTWKVPNIMRILRGLFTMIKGELLSYFVLASISLVVYGISLLF